VFSGLAKNNHVDALKFIDVKTGDAALSPVQQGIKKAIVKKAIERGALRFHSV
jgi:hypothetical protein